MTELLDTLKKRMVVRLSTAGIEESEREIDLIVQHVTGWTVAKQHLEAENAVQAEVAQKIESLVLERTERTPLQYVLGEAWFMGLRFHVRPGVLIPRSDTEILVETVLAKLPEAQPLKVLDVGTGSGAIAISLAKLRPNWRFVAIDKEASVLVTAKENAEYHDVSAQIEFVCADWFLCEPASQYDAFVSNPPYIPWSEADSLQPEVFNHEPHSALFEGDAGGLGFYRDFADRAQSFLHPGALIAVEVGAGQAERVRKLFAAHEWRDLEVRYDLNKIPRVVSGFCP